MQRRVRWIEAGLVVLAVALAGLGPGILWFLVPALILAAVSAAVFSGGRAAVRHLPPGPRRAIGKLLDGAFILFIVAWTGASVLWLLAGLGAAVAGGSASLHRSLHEWGGTPPVSERAPDVVANDIKFDTDVLEFQGAGEYVLTFTNLDPDAHNIAIYRDPGGRDPVFVGAIITGTASVVYEFELPGPGEYYFRCDPHPEDMRGRVVVGSGPGPAPPRETGLPSALAGLAQRTAEASHARQPTGRVVLHYVFSAINLALGLVLFRLRPRDAAARLLAVAMIGTAAVFNLQAHTALTVLPGYGAWHDQLHLISGICYMLALLVFPSGKLPTFSRRLEVRVPLRVLTSLVFLIAGLILAGRHGDPSSYVVFFGIVTPVAGLVSQVSRYRHPASSEERHQSRLLLWAFGISFAGALAFFALVEVLEAVQSSERTLGQIRREVFAFYPALFALLPITLVAVLMRYRLWDVERVLNRTLVYGTLATIISVVYVAVVVGISRAVGGGDEANIALAILATAAVAVAFEPLRDRLQRVANVLVYGKRATPYEAMSTFSRHLAGALSLEEVLPRMAEAATRGVGASRARVRLFLPGEDRDAVTVTWPAGSGEESFERVVDVTHRGEVVGEIAVAKPAGEPLSPAEEKLLSDLASQAGLALRNVRLHLELRARLDQISAQAAELRRSRQRIVAAQDAERRRLERDIHDGVQQQLASMGVKLRLATDLIDRDPERTAALLDNLGGSANETLESLRDLARGIFPPLLADKGLAAALDAQVRKAGIPVRLVVDEPLRTARFAPRTEAAAYFCCLEALANATKHAGGAGIELRLDRRDGWLEFTVRDAGPGFDPAGAARGSGLQNMADRVEALGGRLEVRSTPGQGTVVVGRIPTAPSDARRAEVEP